jgi:hypothetical protein
MNDRSFDGGDGIAIPVPVSSLHAKLRPGLLGEWVCGLGLATHASLACTDAAVAASAAALRRSCS